MTAIGYAQLRHEAWQLNITKKYYHIKFMTDHMKEYLKEENFVKCAFH